MLKAGEQHVNNPSSLSDNDIRRRAFSTGTTASKQRPQASCRNAGGVIFAPLPMATALVLFWSGLAVPAHAQPWQLGPLLHQFPLTLSAGDKVEALGPLFYRTRTEETVTWGMPPLLSGTHDRGTDSAEFDFLYPLMTYDRFGAEYRWQLIQLLSLSGGQTQQEAGKDRFTIFPFYFQQRAADSNLNYTALLPFYGTLKNRLLRDEIHVVLFPLYSQTRKRDVVTRNYLFPFFHLRHGDGLRGWQFWPLVGSEHKQPLWRTNTWGDAVTNGGHHKFFALWPIWLDSTVGLGTENPDHTFAILPLYSQQRSPRRDATTVLWPFFNVIDDRARKYREWQFPWPLIVFARPAADAAPAPSLRAWPGAGESRDIGKTVNRILPFFNVGYNATHKTESYLWPVYLAKSVHSPPLERERVRLLFFLYSDLTERNTETGAELRRVDCWPLFTARRDLQGHRRLQILAPLEPLLPGNKSIERNYSPLWSLWRSERNAQTGAASQSLLWNLYRRDTTPESRKTSLLFGLFQYQSAPAGKCWRLFYVPFGRTGSSADQPR
jgi:hypothetical protein